MLTTRPSRPLAALAVGLLVAALAGAGPLGCASGAEASRTEGPEATQQQLRRARSHYDLGLDHLSQGRSAMALKEFMSSLELNPDDPWTHYSIAEAYRRKGRTAEAEQHLLRALELKPDLQAARLNLSALYVQMQRFDDAIAQCQMLLADPTFPAPWRALTNLGWAQSQLGRPTEARQSFEAALEYRDYWPAALNLGILDAQEGQSLQALERFEQVLALEPGEAAAAEANYRIAELLIAIGDRDRAIEHLTAASQVRNAWGKRSNEALKLLR
jgi:Tfp pilus assembly protein PilF